MMNIFMEKSCRKWAPTASPRPLFILVNNPKQSLHARNKIFERGLSKTLSLLMDKVIKYKRGLELVTSHSLDYETSSQKFLY